MPFLRVAAVLAFAVTPCAAEEFAIRTINNSAVSVLGLNLFPLGEDGEAIEDNLGGFSDVLIPGATAVSTINAACGPMLAVVVLAAEDDLRLKLDTCRDSVLVVRD